MQPGIQRARHNACAPSIVHHGTFGRIPLSGLSFSALPRPPWTKTLMCFSKGCVRFIGWHVTKVNHEGRVTLPQTSALKLDVQLHCQHC